LVPSPKASLIADVPEFGQLSRRLMASQQGNFPVNILLLLIGVADVSHLFSGA
jgi:hypothetical protein